MNSRAGSPLPLLRGAHEPVVASREQRARVSRAHGPPPAYARRQAAGRGRGGAVAAGEPRHSAWGARRGGPVSGARRPRAGR